TAGRAGRPACTGSWSRTRRYQHEWTAGLVRGTGGRADRMGAAHRFGGLGTDTVDQGLRPAAAAELAARPAPLPRRAGDDLRRRSQHGQRAHRDPRVTRYPRAEGGAASRRPTARIAGGPRPGSPRAWTRSERRVWEPRRPARTRSPKWRRRGRP